MSFTGKELYTAQEVADLTGVKILTVYRWIKEGKLKATKLGHWKIYREDLQKALGTSLETFDRLKAEKLDESKL